MSICYRSHHIAMVTNATRSRQRGSAGTMAHDLFERALSARDFTVPFLNRTAQSVVHSHAADLYRYVDQTTHPSSDYNR